MALVDTLNKIDNRKVIKEKRFQFEKSGNWIINKEARYRYASKGADLTPLKPLKKLHRRAFMTFDCETFDGLKGKHLFCWALGLKSKGKYLQSIGGYNNENDWNRLLERIDNSLDKSHRRVIFVHNLGFDVRFIMDYITKHEYCPKSIKRKIREQNKGKSQDELFELYNQNKIRLTHSVLQSGSGVIAYVLNELGVKFVDSFQFLLSSQESAESDYLLENNSNYLKDIFVELIERKEDSEQYFFDYPQLKENLEYYFDLCKIDCKDLFEKDSRLWSNEDRIRIVKHNLNDVMALYEIMDKFRKIVFDLSQIDMLTSNSLASMSLRCFRRELEKPLKNPFVNFKIEEKNAKKRLTYCYDKENEEFVRNSYFGGRCEVFDTNIHENASYVDRVSMYPTVMKQNYFPSGISLRFSSDFLDYLYDKRFQFGVNKAKELAKKDKEFMNNCLDMNSEFEGFIYCRVKPNYNCERDKTKVGKFKRIIEFDNQKCSQFPILPEKLNDRLVFTNCERYGTYALPELRFAKLIGYEIECLKGFIFVEKKFNELTQQIDMIPSRDKIFEKFIDKYFTVKQKEKGGKKKTAKIVLNSTYGKFGEQFKRNSAKFHYFDTKEQQLEFLQSNENMKIAQAIYNAEFGKFVCVESMNSVNIKPYMNVAIASYVTSYARIDLLYKIYCCITDNIQVFYCDTDSITIDSCNLQSVIENSKDLGGWAIEESFEKVRFLAPKSYFGIVKGKPFLKMKGVDRNKIDEIKQNCIFMEEIEQQIRQPIQLAERYMTLKQAHRYGIILTTKKLCKHYSFENNKRLFENGISQPFSNQTLPEVFKKKIEV